ncbi:hypothetical protein ABZX88_11210 [Kitasatospora aureofaciens]|uniref:hypothetical protein n=1 Tax=Kitasatospora aureofaciens TaxID=1894 RepID=UPI0005242FD5|nr:hypothetical protein [Kitasatospora aureofaciens]HJD80530.1 hypothetical protein [Kitasatospora aureofaciens]
MSIPNDDNITAFQDNWRFCNNCCSLWWNGRSDNGACPSPNSPDGQHHGQGSWNFYLPANPDQTI